MPLDHYVVVSGEQRARLDAVSQPQLAFPAPYHRTLSPALAFGGTTVDGVSVPASLFA